MRSEFRYRCLPGAMATWRDILLGADRDRESVRLYMRIQTGSHQTRSLRNFEY